MSENIQKSTCLIIHPIVSGKVQSRSPDEQIEEIQGLAAAIDLDVIEVKILNVTRIQAGAFLGKGQRENIKAQAEQLQPDIIIFNFSLSPVQQRNLERDWKAKVIDRTGLILEIFGARASTKEGRLQVELAAMQYQRSRLVRSWTHLERQRGGAGFMGGPGETQIELDRRIIGERITKLKKEISDVSRTRELGRKSRERIPFPIVALVGYTNAGKSTLFNTLTGAKVFAKDLLFATLDPTMRRIELPSKHGSGQNIILSDTVGFISDLPTHLIAAFRATLEQTLHADVILHIIDTSSPDYESQRKDVIKILNDLGIEYETDSRIIEVYNKIDKLDHDQIPTNHAQKIYISAAKAQGLEPLKKRIAAILSHNFLEVLYKIPYQDGKALSWLYENSEIIDRNDQNNEIHCNVRIDKANADKFLKRFKYKP